MDAPRRPAAFDGQNFVVAWGGRSRFSGNQQTSLYAARITPAGVSLDPNAIKVENTKGDIYHTSVVFDGTNHVVIYIDKNTNKLLGVRVSPAGVVLDAMPVELASHPGCAYLSLAERGAVMDGGRIVVAYRACGPTMTDETAVVLSSEVRRFHVLHDGCAMQRRPMRERDLPERGERDRGDGRRRRNGRRGRQRLQQQFVGNERFGWYGRVDGLRW